MSERLNDSNGYSENSSFVFSFYFAYLVSFKQKQKIENSSRLICGTSSMTYLHQCSGYINTSICYWSVQSKKV